MRIVSFLRLRLLFCALTAFLFFHPSASGAATENILYSFDPFGHGNQPNGGLVSDTAGNVYGGAAWGGFYGLGCVYEFVPNSQGGWAEKILYSFKGGADLFSPHGMLTLDSAGNIYGSTTWGGLGGLGGIFKLTQAASGEWKESILHVFSSGSDGYSPNGGLVFDAAGNLYGTTTTQNSGTSAFGLTPSTHGGWIYRVIFRFPSNETPNGNLAVDRAGNLYGTVKGPPVSTNFGAVFELSPSSRGVWMESTLYSFTGGADGGAPLGGLTVDSSGSLFGAASQGGVPTCSGGCGTIFKLTPESNGSWNETVIYTFQNERDGVGPSGNLVFDSAGNLYGTTVLGDYGLAGETVFELSPASDGAWTKTTLWQFPVSGPSEMQSGVAVVSLGIVYAAISYFGPFNNGEVVALTPAGGGQWSETAVTYFAPTDAGSPSASLIADSAGNLYGSTSLGGAFNDGAVFKLTKSADGGWKETILYSFPNPAGDSLSVLVSSLTLDAAGNLYGETANGGALGFGSVFQLTPGAQGWTEKDIYIFNGKNGRKPQGGLIFDQSGNLYGTTQGGGASTGCGFGCGTVFELSPGSGKAWTETILYNFTGGSDAAVPLAGLVFDSAGNLYGTTERGGTGDNGTVFELSPGSSGWTENVLYRFTGTHGDGKLPMAGLAIDAARNLYGTTSEGGTYGFDYCFGTGCGTVFQLSPTSGGWKETVVNKLAGTDGTEPLSTPVLDEQGNIYVTASFFDGLGGGSVIELSPASGGAWNETILHMFAVQTGAAQQDGYACETGLFRGVDGSLYGTTVGGGISNEGIVFQIIP